MNTPPEIYNEIIIAIKGGEGDHKLIIETKNKQLYTIKHKQICCENVWVGQIIGDLQELVGQKITKFWGVNNKQKLPGVGITYGYGYSYRLKLQAGNGAKVVIIWNVETNYELYGVDVLQLSIE